jgi:hypothetical protein
MNYIYDKCLKLIICMGALSSTVYYFKKCYKYHLNICVKCKLHFVRCNRSATALYNIQIGSKNPAQFLVINNRRIGAKMVYINKIIIILIV